MQAEIIAALNKARHNRQAAIVVSNLESGTQAMYLENDTVSDPEISREVTLRLRSGKSGIARIEGREVFFNAHIPAPRLVIIGAVHISQALAPISRIAGFDTVVIDPRTAFATKERFPGIALHSDWPEDILQNEPLDAYTALAAVTHDPKIDDFPLISAIRKGCFYIGALGSRKTHAKRVERLTSAGISPQEIAKIHAPIGVDIAASNPAEIAVSVMAEVIDAFRKRGTSSDTRGGSA